MPLEEILAKVLRRFNELQLSGLFMIKLHHRNIFLPLSCVCLADWLQSAPWAPNTGLFQAVSTSFFFFLLQSPTLCGLTGPPIVLQGFLEDDWLDVCHHAAHSWQRLSSSSWFKQIGWHERQQQSPSGPPILVNLPRLCPQQMKEHLKFKLAMFTHRLSRLRQIRWTQNTRKTGWEAFYYKQKAWNSHPSAANTDRVLARRTRQDADSQKKTRGNRRTAPGSTKNLELEQHKFMKLLHEQQVHCCQWCLT